MLKLTIKLTELLYFGENEIFKVFGFNQISNPCHIFIFQPSPLTTIYVELNVLNQIFSFIAVDTFCDVERAEALPKCG